MTVAAKEEVVKLAEKILRFEITRFLRSCLGISPPSAHVVV